MLSIAKASFTFTQDGNTMGTTDDHETLVVDLEYQTLDPGKGDECFAVIRTDGWSVESGDEIALTVDACKKHTGELSREGRDDDDIRVL